MTAFTQPSSSDYFLTVGFTCLIACAASVGCRPANTGPPRFSIEGTVTFRGEPVPMGRITFEPDSSAGNRGPVGMSDITVGRFASGQRFGSVGGPHLVRIEGFELPGSEGLRPDESPKPLFQEYSTKVDLPRAPAVHDFAIPDEHTGKKGNR
jgi:hypothetical protein